MLEQLHLVNFQCHEDLTIEFDPHITCIVGDTDSGKSGILRALRFVTRNSPTTGIIRWGQKGCAAKLVVDNREVIREKSKTLNRYALDSQEYASFGTDVPRDIQNLLKMGDINFGGQHEAPFWFDLSAPEVSRQLNSVVDLSFMDEVLSKAAGEIRSARSAAEICKQRLDAARSKKDGLAWVLGLDEQLFSIEAKETRLVEIVSRRAVLEVVIKDAQDATRAAADAAAIECGTGRAISVGEQLLETGRRRQDLYALIEDIKKAQEAANRPVLDLDPLEKIQEKLQKVSRDRQQLTQLIEEVRSWQLVVQKAEEVIEETEKNLAGAICPTCGQKIRS